MRPVLLLTLLLSSACATGTALAQSGSNWVDPPAKSEPAPAASANAAQADATDHVVRPAAYSSATPAPTAHPVEHYHHAHHQTK
ncbi:hypothetical protein ACU6QO_00380, partial [Aeromonas veronii]|uniref:hypothetical protein n=1 Tax=Aeromonas veronii TaxID=654 RepID=UPI00406CD48D